MKKMIALTLAGAALGTALISSVTGVQADTIGVNQTTLNLQDNFSSSPVAILYQLEDGRGGAHIMFEDIRSLLSFPGFNRNVRSIRLSPGAKVEAYAHLDFGGGVRTLINTNDTEMTVNLTGTWRNQVSSLKLFSYTEGEFGVNLASRREMLGRQYRITEPQSNYDLSSSDFDNQVTSLELYPNTGIIMFDQPGLMGEFAFFENTTGEVMYVDLTEEAPQMLNRISSYSAYSLT